MRDRPGDLGLRPFGDLGTQPLPAPPPNNAPIMAAALGTLRDASKTRTFWILFATFFICGAQHQWPDSGASDSDVPRFRNPQVQAASLLAAMGIFDFVGTIASVICRTASTTVICCPGITACAGCRWCSCRSRIFRSTACRCSRCSMASTGLRPCRRTVRLTAQRFGPERANLVFGWIFAGHQLGAATAAFGRRIIATLLASYLPAFFVAGALCIVASLITLGDRTRAEAGSGLTFRHCERSEAIQGHNRSPGLLRRYAPRNDGATYGLIDIFVAAPWSGSARPDARTRTIATSSCAGR